MTKFLISAILLLFTLNSRAENSDESLMAFLRANNLPPDTVQKIAAQEALIEFTGLLTPKIGLKIANMEVNTVYRQNARLSFNKEAIVLSTAMAAAGVVCFALPIPGTSALGIVLIQKGVAIAITATAIGAGGTYAITYVSEKRELREMSSIIKEALNDFFRNSKLESQVGEIVRVKLSNTVGLAAFDTSFGYHFQAGPYILPEDTRFLPMPQIVMIAKDLENPERRVLIDLQTKALIPEIHASERTENFNPQP